MTHTKDWTGTPQSPFRTIGARGLTPRDPLDYYATEPRATLLLLEQERFAPQVWEPASGGGHMAAVLRQAGYAVRASDIVPRLPGTEALDFLSPANADPWPGDIVTNPPYRHALAFVQKALSLVGPGRKVAMFLKLTFLEGRARRRLFDTQPPRTVYVSSSRLLCARGGDFDSLRRGGGSAVAYAWFLWQKGHEGDTVVRWIN